MTAAATRATPIWNYQRPWLYPAQQAAIFCRERYGLIEASTKAGKSSGCMVWLTEQTLPLKRGQATWWIAPVRAQAKVIFERFKTAAPREIYDDNDTELKLTLANGAAIWFKGAERPDLLYGDDVYAAVIDEASRLREAAWHAVRSTLTATKGPIRIIGNVKGRKNWFYRLARLAESGEKDMHYAKLTAADAVKGGILEAAEVKDAQSKLPPAVFRELYLAEPSDDEGNPFGLEAILACVAPAISTSEPAVWGWDLAKSHDWTVGVALDRKGRVCRLARWQKPWLECIAQIQRLTGQTPALVDASGVGSPIVETLQRSTRIVKNDKGQEEAVPAFGNFEGFTFTAASKQALMEGLAAAIHQRRVTFPPGPIVSELEAFEYVYTRTGVRYSAPEGLHDDCVIALGLAVAKIGMADTHEGDDWLRMFGAMSRGHVSGRDPDVGRREFEDDEDRRPVF